MSDIISADLIAEGDVIRLHRLAAGDRPIFAVSEVRQIRLADTRAELRCTNTATGSRADISLSHSTVVERLESLSQAEIAEALPYLQPGEQLNITYWSQRFWV